MKNEHMGNVLGFFEIFSEWENRGGDGGSADGSQEGAPLKDVLPHPTATLHATLFTFLILVNICFAETFGFHLITSLQGDPGGTRWVGGAY